MLRTILFAVALLWASLLFGADNPVVMVHNTLDPGAGSGCVVDVVGTKRCAILTAAHIFENGHGKVLFKWTSGEWAHGYVVWMDKQNDLAMCVSGVPASGTPHLDMCKPGEAPRPGETVTVYGYPLGQYRAQPVVVRGYEQEPFKDWLSFDNRATISGFSGGPIVWKGKVIAVLSGGMMSGPGPHAHAVNGHGGITHYASPGIIKYTQWCRPGNPNCRILRPDQVRVQTPPQRQVTPTNVPGVPTAEQVAAVLIRDHLTVIQGPKGEPGENGKVTSTHIEKVTNDVTLGIWDRMIEDPTPFKGDKGDKGDDGEKGDSPDIKVIVNEVLNRLEGRPTPADPNSVPAGIEYYDIRPRSLRK